MTLVWRVGVMMRDQGQPDVILIDNPKSISGSREFLVQHLEAPSPRSSASTGPLIRNGGC